jgi:hypothetical protein
MDVAFLRLVVYCSQGPFNYKDISRLYWCLRIYSTGIQSVMLVFCELLPL